jgi:DNA segregation ATPase FtsK/SpoIIIE, S-DNA-T family
MARKRKKKKRGSSGDFGLSDGAKQSIFAITILALAGIFLLSFFGLAGSFGELIDDLLSAVFGWDRWFFGLVLLVIGWGAIFPDRRMLSGMNLFGISLFFIAFNGLLNLLFIDTQSYAGEVAVLTGGYVGLVVSNIVVGVLGFWGAFVIAIALMLVAVMLTFNTSLHSMLSVHTHFTSLGRAMHRRGHEDEYEDEEEEAIWEDDEEELEEGDGEEEEYEESEDEDHAGVAPESIMTTARRRKMEIPIDLLDNKSSEAKPGDIDRGQEVIRRTFENFGINVEMRDVKVGPSVTQYALKPAEGVKLSRIVGLQNDLALALAAHPIRIEAPIPGKSLVGIEVPNQSIGKVTLRELLESQEFKRRATDFSSPLGKDVAGVVQSVLVDKAPHMLVAGATGSGKSVCLNVIIASLLYQNGPDDLKFVFVDPKRVELGVYAGIPHLLVPPITKVEEAINALKWAVREMERRLDHLAKFGVRDIDAYNKKSKERMPKIVIVIDELSDLMSQNKRDVEAVIVRIAQMARAAGIHLILATQRPSVDVITGIIKANIPTRLAFAVASQVDSKTILDVSGADKLLGRGDMLMSTPQTSKPRRLQGAYISDEEIKKIINFLKKEGEPDYNYQITEDSRTGGTAMDSSSSDPLFEEAVQVVIDSGKASTSFLQRRLKIGYSRAARIVDIMEEAGIIGPQNGSKPRIVLIDEWPIGGKSKQVVEESEENEEFEESDDDEDYEDTVDEQQDEEEHQDEDYDEEGDEFDE